MSSNAGDGDVKGAIFSDEQEADRQFPQLRCTSCGHVIGFRFLGKGQRWPKCCGLPMVRVETTPR